MNVVPMGPVKDCVGLLEVFCAVAPESDFLRDERDELVVFFCAGAVLADAFVDLLGDVAADEEDFTDVEDFGCDSAPITITARKVMPAILSPLCLRFGLGTSVAVDSSVI
jgi:hypothetical protein